MKICKFGQAFIIALALSLTGFYACNGDNYRDQGIIGNPQKPLMVNPDKISQYGHQWIVIENLMLDLSDSSAIEVFVSNQNCLFTEALSSNSLKCFVQGSALPGKAVISVKTNDQEQHEYGALEYLPAVDLAFKNFWAIGGGFFAGEQNRSLIWNAQLDSPASLVAKKLGAYFPQPLVKSDGVTKYLGIDDLNPQDGSYDEENEAAEILKYATDFDLLRSMRLDDKIEVQNVSIPSGGDAQQLLAADNISEREKVYRNLIRDRNQLETEVAPAFDLLNATPSFLLVSHQLLESAFNFKYDSPEEFVGQVKFSMNSFLSYLYRQPVFPYVVILNYPPPSMYPGEKYDSQKRYQTIWINNALSELAKEINYNFKDHPRVFVVDQYSFFNDILSARFSVNLFGKNILLEEGANGEINLFFSGADDEQYLLGFDFMEGLFSLDKKTFSKTGNTLIANLILQRIDQQITAQPLQLYDLAEIIKGDPLSSLSMDQELKNLLFAPKDRLADETGYTVLSQSESCAINFRADISAKDEDCPASIVSLSGDSIEMNGSDSVAIAVKLANFKGEILPDAIIVARTSSGELLENEIKTDSGGRAVFVYSPKEDVNFDYLYLVSGEASLRITLFKRENQ